MTIILVLLAIAATAGIGGAAYFYKEKLRLVKKLKDPKRIEMSEDEAIEKASIKAKNILLEAEKQALETRTKLTNKLLKQEHRPRKIL